MPGLVVTPATAAATGLLLVLLAVRVIVGRQRRQVSLGDGGNTDLLQAIRTHANLAEYAPLTLILLLLVELRWGPSTWLAVVAGAFLLARLAHVAGLARPAPNAWRVLGTAGTFTAILLVAGWLLVGLVRP